MARLPLPKAKPEAPGSPEELFGRLHITDERLDNLWSEQADVLRTYAEAHIDDRDVALELPTGSGKTLVGLLIAEWRRLKLGERTAFVCPTNQLARQVHAKSLGYGIEPVLLIESSESWDPAQQTRFDRGETIAITNYHHVFNRRPRIEAQTLILDDAHTAEGPVANRWSLKIKREAMRGTYMSVIDILAGELPKAHLQGLRNDELDQSRRRFVEVVLPDGTHRVSEQLAEVIAPAVHESTEWFAWDAIGAQLETCLIYVSWSEILVRPFIAPTFTQDAFSDANQRIYLSATIGAGGELERSFGREPIERIPKPLTWDREGSGRRYMIAPGAGRDGDAANHLIQDVVDRVGRALLLAPSGWRLRRAAERVIPDWTPTLGAEDIEQGLDTFTEADRAVLQLANRYDGIDLPGEACSLIVMSGLPTGTHLQEHFLNNRLGARHALAERIRTRITQGVGRATRSRRDTAVIVLHGDDLIGFLAPKEDRAMLRSEIQAELEIAFTTAELPQEEILESIDSFLAQDDDWQPTEEYLREYAEEHPQQDPPGAEQLTAAAPHEVAAWREAWRGNYDEAASTAQRAAAALNHPTMSPYRAWWLALAASWSVIADGPEARRSVALSRDADLATRRLSWRPPLNALPDTGTPTTDEALAVRADKATQWLRRRSQSPKLERDLTALESGIEDPDAKKFEVALQTLGQLLGFDAERPAKEEAAPDGAWQDGSRAWILWEAKTEEGPGGKVSAEETRQANSHADWVRHNYSWTEPESAITVMVTPKQALHQSVSGVAAPHLYVVPPTTITEISHATVEIHRQLSGQIIGLEDDEAADRMATALKAKKLDTASLIDRLSTTPLRGEGT
jgi:hypothetical protein